MFRHRLLLFHHHPLPARPAFSCYFLHPISQTRQCPARHSSSVTSSFRNVLPSTLRRRDKKVRRTRPLPLAPSPSSRFHKRRRFLWYALAFILSGAITYTTFQPDNHANHVFHGAVRVSRVIMGLAHCVYDYRTIMRRQYVNEQDREREMSDCHLRCARRALRAFEKNGGIYIKVGQHLAALSYLIPIVKSLSFQN